MPTRCLRGKSITGERESARMKYRVVTHVLEECIYEVDADNPKEAEAKSVNASPISTETIQEETMSITPAQGKSGEPK